MATIEYLIYVEVDKPEHQRIHCHVNFMCPDKLKGKTTNQK